MTRTVGYFRSEDRNSVVCVGCADAIYDEGGGVDDPITEDWDGVQDFRCERCGRLLLEVANDGA